ncbi:MAG: DUF1810 domain-containing protein [Solirubrobacteraceae bacterium]
MASDPFQLSRFTAAQDAGGTYERALSELRAGRKSTHWMWFVFPQLAGLGQSATSRRYAIRSLNEARAYLADGVLGGRLRDCASILLEPEGLSAEQIFGAVDAVKLRSSMTLFERAAPEESCFGRVLQDYFGGERDAATERLLSSEPHG